ncbi:MAG: STAS domain-containing protein [Desulfobacteraceae bacterium]|nr:STAS domain-containing protein [Desulfobacteraceae bacterium]
MPEETAAQIKIPLGGDWSMNGVTSQLPHLVEQLATLSACGINMEGMGDSKAHLAELTLAGINEFDASGCQLLVIFLKNLKQRGVMPRIMSIPDAIREKIQFLGFAREIGPYFETKQGYV